MSKLSLLDKLSLFIDVAKDSLWSVLILLILIVLVYLFSKTDKKTMKRNKIIYIGFSLLVLIILLIIYLPSIGKVFDNWGVYNLLYFSLLLIELVLDILSWSSKLRVL